MAAAATVSERLPPLSLMIPAKAIKPVVVALLVTTRWSAKVIGVLMVTLAVVSDDLLASDAPLP